MGEAPSAKAEVHKAIPAPARAFSPRRLVYGRALCPLMGVAPCVLPASARLRPCLRPLMGEVPCVLPASARLWPRPCPLMGELPCAGWGRAKAKADAPSRSNPPLSVYRPALAA